LPICGNGKCEINETSANCPTDCGCVEEGGIVGGFGKYPSSCCTGLSPITNSHLSGTKCTAPMMELLFAPNAVMASAAPEKTNATVPRIVKKQMCSRRTNCFDI